MQEEKEKIEKKYKVYNLLFSIMTKFVIAIMILAIIMLIYTYFFGTEPSGLCGFLSGGCDREYGMTAINTYIFGLLVLAIYGFPFILAFIIILIIIYFKKEKYKELKTNFK